MTEAEWLASSDATAMLDYLAGAGQASERKLRLFACACVRRASRLLGEGELARGVEVSERFADGQADKEELRAARIAALEVERQAAAVAFSYPYQPERREYQRLRVIRAAADTARGWLGRAAQRAGEAVREPGWAAQAAREVFNPFRPLAVQTSWLAWAGGTGFKLARVIYEERAFDRLPILADALEDAGCDNADILGHLRGPGPHVRGCWALDLILGKS
jgi:hypothetical protein